jgi:hypothetical protein
LNGITRSTLPLEARKCESHLSEKQRSILRIVECLTVSPGTQARFWALQKLFQPPTVRFDFNQIRHRRVILSRRGSKNGVSPFSSGGSLNAKKWD